MEKLMGEASVGSPLLDVRQCQKDPLASAEAPRVNGQQELIPWEELEISETIKTHREEHIQPDSYRPVDLQTEVEADQWESNVLPVYPMSHPATRLSFTTMQWDTPGPSSDTPSPMTDSSSADELDWTVSPLSFHQFKEMDAEVSTQDDTETWDGSDVLRSLKPTAGQEESASQASELCGNIQPCDDTDIGEEETRDEDEELSRQLLEDNGEMLRLDLGEENGMSVTEDSVEPMETVPSPQESVDPEPQPVETVPSPQESVDPEPQPVETVPIPQESVDPEPQPVETVPSPQESVDPEPQPVETVPRPQESVDPEPQPVETVPRPQESVDPEPQPVETVPSPQESVDPEPQPVETVPIPQESVDPEPQPVETVPIPQESVDPEPQPVETVPIPQESVDPEPQSVETVPRPQESVDPEPQPVETVPIPQESVDPEPQPVESVPIPQESVDPEPQPVETVPIPQESVDPEPQPVETVPIPQESVDPEPQPVETVPRPQESVDSGLGVKTVTSPKESVDPEPVVECEREEQEGPVILLTGQEPCAATANGVKNEEENEEGGHADGEQAEVFHGECEEREIADNTCPRETEQAGELDHPGITVMPDQLIHSDQSDQLLKGQQSENETGSEKKDLSEHLHEQRGLGDQSKDLEEVENEQAKCEEVREEAEAELSEASQQPQHDEDAEKREGSENSISEQRVLLNQTQGSEDSEQSKEPEHLEQTQQMEQRDESKQPEHLEPSKPTEQTDRSRQPKEVHSEQAQCPEASSGQPEVTEQPRRMEQSEENKQPPSDTEVLSEQPGDPLSKQAQRKPPKIEVSVFLELTQEDKQGDGSDQTGHPECAEECASQMAVDDRVQSEPSGTAKALLNGGGVDREKAARLADRLHKLDGIRRTDVVKHLDKDNDFSRAVGEEYLNLFDFTDQTLDQGLRAFLKVVVLIGETQERERVLQHFSSRFHQCNPQSLPSAGSVLTLTCALMLLNTDLHGQNVGKAMSSSSFVSNLDTMNEGDNFDKDLLKSLYSSVKSEPFEWAVDEDELKTSMLLEEDAKEDAPPRSKSNPFQDVPHDKKATVFKQGFLQRKAHADIDGKRIPWGRRSWKTFYGILKGMVLYLQKDEYRKEYQSTEEVVSVHHALAERAADYTKKPHVFRLQTADWRVFLFQASSRMEMDSWIGRINLVTALHSSPPFPAAVGSQRRFCRPILPAQQASLTLERQLQSHAGMLESFQADLAYLQEDLPEGRRAKAKELEEHRLREEYLHHETCRYEFYLRVLEAWKGLDKTPDAPVGTAELNLFDKALYKDSPEALGEEDEEDEEGGLKKSHSSPSLELETGPSHMAKVRRNISERRTYRRIIIPRQNKEL